MTTNSHATIDDAASCLDPRPKTLRTVRAPTPVRPRTEPPASIAAASSAGMIYVVSEPKVAQPAPVQLIGATVVEAALWFMFAAGVAQTIVF
jgi:hypothetical protein